MLLYEHACVISISFLEKADWVGMGFLLFPVCLLGSADAIPQIDTQTTLPFGYTTDSLTAELMKVEEANQCLKPLVEHLFGSPCVDLCHESLVEETIVWIEKRGDQHTPSFEEVDPKLGPLARYVWNLMSEKATIQMELCAASKEMDTLLQNLEKAVKIMIQRQRDLMYAAGHSIPEEVGLYKVKVQGIEIWRQKKMMMLK